MFDFARIFLCEIMIHSKQLKERPERFVSLIDPCGYLASRRGESDRTVGLHIDIAAFFQSLYCIRNTRLVYAKMLCDIYEQTAASCEASGAYLEWCAKDTPGNYTASECIDISTAMKADGIIVYPDGSEGLEDSIARASDAGIPVVTILRDLPAH